MRALRGARVVPVVRLSHRPMKTSFGMKHRPEFEVDRLAPVGRRWRRDLRSSDAAAHRPDAPDRRPTRRRLRRPSQGARGADDRGHAIGEARQRGGIRRRRNPVVNDQLRGAQMPLPFFSRVTCHA